VLDARIVVSAAAMPGTARLAIKPYPQALEESFEWNGQLLHVRPVRPEDEVQYRDFFAALSPADIHFRFFAMVRQLPHSQLARMTQIDYDREMGFVAFLADGDSQGDRYQRMLGIVQVIADPDNVGAEFAIAVRSASQGQGLGGILLRKTVEYCRHKGTTQLVGEILRENIRMIALAKECGFKIEPTSTWDVVRATLAFELHASKP